MNVQQYYYDNFIDAKNEFTGGGGGGDLNIYNFNISNATSNIFINNNPSFNRLDNYVYSSNDTLNNTTHLYLINSNTYGEIRLGTLITKVNSTRDHDVRINKFGKLEVYHPYDITNPTVLEGWKDVENELSGLIFGLQANGLEIIVVQGQIAGINTAISQINGTLTTLEAYNTATVANLEAIQYGFFNIDEYNEFVMNNFSALTARYSTTINNYATVANSARVGEFVGGVLVPAGIGAVIAGIYNYLDYTNLHNIYSNVLSSNPNLTQQERKDIQNPSSNLIRNTYISFNSNFCNMSLEQGFINSNITDTQLVPSLKSNKVLLGDITTPNASYQMEGTGDINFNEYYQNSTSLTTLLGQKQDNMSATQPIFITTANIGLNYDSSLTKVGNNLSVVKTATTPLAWTENNIALSYDSSLTKVGNNLSVVKTATTPLAYTGNNIALNYDSTLTKVGNNLSVASATASKWTTSGTNIYNNNIGNVGINDTDPQTRLSVQGDTYISGITTLGLARLNFISSYTGATLTLATGTSEYYLQYTGNGTLVLSEPIACDLLVVGAGGNGGTGASSGGGGAGEVIYYPNFPLRNGTLTINIGTSSTTSANRISSITHSTGTQIIAKGGGNGGTPENLFTANGSISFNTNAIAVFNYTNTSNLSPASYSITFSTGAITLTGITADKSYPILKDGSGNNINPYVWYKFDTDAFTNDSSGNNNHLSNIGTGGASNTTTFIKGNSSAYFNATANYFRNSISFAGRDVPISFSFWFNCSVANNNTMVSLNNGTGDPTIQFDYNGNALSVFTALTNQWTTYPTKSGLSTGTWYHVVYTLNNNNPVGTKLYINNVLEATGSGNSGQTLRNSRNYIYLGYSGDFNRGYTGYLDDFRMYDFELSSSQVSELYKGRVVISSSATSGGSGGGGGKSQSGAVAGTKFDEYKSFAQAGLNGSSTIGGNGGSGSSLYNTRFTSTITGSSLSVGLGGTGVGATPATPTTKSNYGDGGDGNGGVGYQGIIIIRFKVDTNYLQVKSIKDNANSGLILNANESPDSYQLRLYPWSDTFQLSGVATRGWSFRCHDRNTHLDLLNLFSSFGGRIGIKTKNPTATLDVNGDVACKTFSVIGSELYGITTQIVNQDATGEANISLSAGTGGNYGGLSLVYVPPDNLGYLSCSKSLKIKTGNDALNSYIYIDNSTGKVGIGITNPSSKLELVGDINSTSMTASTGNFNSISTYGVALNNGNISGVNKLTSVEVQTGQIKGTSLDLDGGNITNGGFFYGMAQQARFLNMSVNEWHYDTQSRNRFYFTNDTTTPSNSHTVFRTGSTTHYFQDKDGTDYCLLDRFGISTYFEVVSGGAYDNIGAPDGVSSGVYVYRRMILRLSTFTEVHRCFIEDELYDNYDDFINEYVGRIVVSKGKIKTALKKEGEPWEIFEGKDGITIDDSHPVVELSRKKKDKAVVGVITKRETRDYPNRLVINSLGEGACWLVNTNGNFEAGDFIQTSDELGYGERQDNDINHNYTLGKVMIDCSFELNNPNYKCEIINEEKDLRRAFIPCFYYSG